MTECICMLIPMRKLVMLILYVFPINKIPKFYYKRRESFFSIETRETAYMVDYMYKYINRIKSCFYH